MNKVDMEEPITSNDLMSFLKSMAKKMDENKETLEEKIDKTNRKIDDRFKTMDEDIKGMKDKMDEAEQANRRMNMRLEILEKEMQRSESIGKRSNKLKNTLTDQQTATSQVITSRQKD